MPEKCTVMDLEKTGISKLGKEDTTLPFLFLLYVFILLL